MKLVYSVTGITLAMMAAAALVACGDDDDNITVGSDFVQALEHIYPDAKGVRWEKERDYRVAELTYDGYGREVWFDSDAQWRMSETDFGRDISQLPEAVAEAISTGDYSQWLIDDIDYYERTDLSFYVVEMEMPRMPEVYVYYLPTGDVMRVQSEPAPDIYPDTAVLPL